MKKKIFIHTNNKQGIGALISKFSFESTLSDKDISVEFINVDKLDVFKKFAGKTYTRNGKEIAYNPQDLQSFTLSRFMPPELMNYEGRAVVVDPDIFALKDISELFSMDMKGKSIACCSKKGAWDTSMMVLDCTKLRHWSMEEILKSLTNKEKSYSEIMTLETESNDSVLEVSRLWNSLDTLTPETNMIHMTNRLTQPWKTGLAIDFTRNSPGKYFGLIPKIWVLRLRGKWPSSYQKHPDKNIENLFFSLAKKAYLAGSLTKADIEKDIQSKDVRADMLQYIA
jgi:hypothetical protein